MTNLQKAINLVRAIGNEIGEFSATDYIDAIVSALDVSRNNASIYLAKSKRALGFTAEMLAYNGADVDFEVESGETKIDFNFRNLRNRKK